MTLVLSNDDVSRLLTIHDCIDALEEAYVELANGRAVSRPALGMSCTCERRFCLWHYFVRQHRSELGVGCSRITSDILTWPKHGASARRVKVPAAPNGRFVGLVLLFSSETGEPLAIFPDGVIQRMRVGAANGIGIKHLARKDARTVAMLGPAGKRGRNSWRRVRCGRSNRSVLQSEPDSRATFSRSMSETLGVPVSAVLSPDAAVDGADIVLCATNAIENVFFERWVRPGLHFSSIKRQEVEVSAMRRTDRLAIHTRDWNPVHYETRGFVNPEGAGSKASKLHDELDFTVVPTLPEIVAGMAAGRQSDKEVTAFINNQGTGYQFAATGAAFYRKAKRRESVTNCRPTGSPRMFHN